MVRLIFVHNPSTASDGSCCYLVGLVDITLSLTGVIIWCSLLYK